MPIRIYQNTSIESLVEASRKDNTDIKRITKNMTPNWVKGYGRMTKIMEISNVT